MEIRREKLTRYVTPLREGGSLPALAEASDGFKYVVKFRGAGHGPKALIAELIGGEKITPRTLSHIVDLIPDEWLNWDDTEMTPDEIRDTYRLFLTERLKNSKIFVKQAIDERKNII